MFELKIEGLGQLEKHLKELEEAARALDGNLCDLRFDPSDEQSVNDAINKMEALVEAKVARWKDNSAVREIAQKSKEYFREQILQQARSSNQSADKG